ncbi:hypothetical protein JAAARDRAFT_198065 [Jaapia argillacea MUCL 33604]|uniref:T6SS Phospholipase effector Tle1-like catalytic domain-containing protein n=1 Tax=Jaapia argillacea MUCL 33604 TaxID=933084 RepID=A0A067PQY2_9AGAM|nr:hypothetical protein JAAARDRAFT_198065 [Jaapia argillacea MUCL 33604]
MSQPVVSSRKRILVFCDGTSADGRRGMTLGAGLTGDGVTNVIRLARAVNMMGKDKASGQAIHQIVSYNIGVGAQSGFDGEYNVGDADELAIGLEVASKIRDAYGFIADNYVEGDEIFLFGWSRGAYTVRKVAGLIYRMGLLSKEYMGLFPQYWAALNNPDLPWAVVPPMPEKPVPIECVGVFDTVGEIDLLDPVIDALGIKDNLLPPNIKHALHALAFHENRDKFMATLWQKDRQEPKDPVLKAIWKTQVLKQVWFAGDHTDVGGGYINHERADIVLYWMAGEIDKLVDLDHDFLKRAGMREPSEAWGMYPPTNALLTYEGVGSILDKRLGLMDPDDLFHESTLLWAPPARPDPFSMLGLKDLQQRFGDGWRPVAAPMNAFESERRVGWGKTDGLIPTFETGVTFALVLNALKNNRMPASKGDVLLVPPYEPNARYTKVTIAWRSYLLEERGEYYVLIVKNKSKGDADVVFFIQAEWYGPDRGISRHINKIARLVKGNYEFTVDTRCQYGQDAEGMRRFVVYHDKTRTPGQLNFVDYNDEVDEVNNALGVLGKGIIGIGQNLLDEPLSDY